MNISYNWLKQFIKINLPIEEVSEILTDLGLEVEGVTSYESIKGGLSGVVVGEVLECKQHPNADRLKVTQVALGKDEIVQIVCGAPNVEKGQKVPVATIGTMLYDKEGNAFKITKSKIRGEVSQGMICAEDELGLGANHDGIMVLEDQLAVGTPCAEVFDIEKDTVFEIGLTPNRADAMSHLGVARDLKAACIQKNIPFNWSSPDVNAFHVANSAESISVEVINTDQAPLYFGVTISNLKITSSPEWLQNRLKAIGLTPKNNVVDVTNYVLHELGQPLHAFDADKIQDKILVKTLEGGTPFVTLDGVERKLHQEDLMICDSKGPLCIAGVFGGLHSGVTEQTKTIFLESAYFDPISIRKTAKRHGLNTDASFRFERGIDPEIGVYALKRAANLIKEFCDDAYISEIEEVKKPLPEEVSLVLNYKHLEKTIGQKIPLEELNAILKSLEIKIISVTEEGIGMTIPRYRVDVTRPADVIEEILRIYGYNNLNPTVLKYVAQPEYSWKNNHKLENSIANQLAALGFFEMMNNSLSSPEHVVTDFYKPVKLLNPLGQELSQMRQSLVFGALETVAFNINRQNKNIKLFEFGTVYGKEENDFKESKRLLVAMTGAVFNEHWDIKHQSSPFFYLKGVVQNIMDSLGIPVEITSKTEKKWFSEGLNIVSKNNTIGAFGAVTKTLCDKFSIEREVYIIDLDWDKITTLAFQQNIVFEDVPKYPTMRRDFALLLDKNIPFSNLKEKAFKQERKILKSVDLFDVYEGKKLPDNKKSYGVSFIFQDKAKTLTDKQVDKVMEKLKNTFERIFDAQLR